MWTLAGSRRRSNGHQAPPHGMSVWSYPCRQRLDSPYPAKIGGTPGIDIIVIMKLLVSTEIGLSLSGQNLGNSWYRYNSYTGRDIMVILKLPVSTEIGLSLSRQNLGNSWYRYDSYTGIDIHVILIPKLTVSVIVILKLSMSTEIGLSLSGQNLGKFWYRYMCITFNVQLNSYFIN